MRNASKIPPGAHISFSEISAIEAFPRLMFCPFCTFEWEMKIAAFFVKCPFAHWEVYFIRFLMCCLQNARKFKENFKFPKKLKTANTSKNSSYHSYQFKTRKLRHFAARPTFSRCFKVWVRFRCFFAFFPFFMVFPAP